MRASIARLSRPPDALLIDALKLPQVPLAQRSMSKGDRKSLTIASASILAKVTRDRELIALGDRYPDYGFARHKGYGTPQHRQALQVLGPLAIHRWTFAPVIAAAARLKRVPPHPTRMLKQPDSAEPA
jgi:ribonuclease HII